MKLTDWLRTSGTSQSELARRVRCSPAAISMIAAGLRTPSATLAQAIIAATDNKVRLADLARSR